MKKIIYSIIAVVLVACTKNDSVFNNSVNQRLNEALANYQQILTSAPHGWKMFTFPSIGGYAYVVNFKTDGTVTVLFDYSDETITLEETTTYRLRALQVPSLVFDTYSKYIHYFSDPDIYKSQVAYRGDFEYAFVNISNDTIFCLGNFNKCKMFLVKAQEGDAAKIKNVSNTFSKIELIATNYWTKLFLDVNHSEYEVVYSLQQPRTITFYYHEDGVKKAFTSGYYFNEHALVLLEPLIHGNTIIDGFRNMEYHEAERELSMLTNSGTPAVIRGVTEILDIDVAAAKEMVTAVDAYYSAMAGFTVYGVSDTFGLTKIPEFVALQLFNNINENENGYLSAFVIFPSWGGYTIENDLSQLNQGIIGFIAPGFDDEPIPEAFSAAFEANLDILLHNKFQVVKSATDKYDLISLDNTIWISFIKTISPFPPSL